MYVYLNNELNVDMCNACCILQSFAGDEVGQLLLRNK